MANTTWSYFCGVGGSLAWSTTHFLLHYQAVLCSSEVTPGFSDRVLRTMVWLGLVWFPYPDFLKSSPTFLRLAPTLELFSPCWSPIQHLLKGKQFSCFRLAEEGDFSWVQSPRARSQALGLWYWVEAPPGKAGICLPLKVHSTPFPATANTALSPTCSMNLSPFPSQ